MDKREFLDFSSPEALESSLRYIGVIEKFGSVESFGDWVEEKFTGEAFDKLMAVVAECAYIESNRVAAEKSGVAG